MSVAVVLGTAACDDSPDRCPDGYCYDGSDPCPDGDCEVISLAAGGGFLNAGGSCVLTSLGEVWCWGVIADERQERAVRRVPDLPEEGRLLMGTGFVVRPPLCVVTEGAVGAGASVACRFVDPVGGEVRQGPLPEVPGDGLRDFALGGGHACYVRQDGAVGCVWLDDAVALGVVEDPPEIIEPDDWSAQVGAAATAIVAGLDHACALTQSGAVYCWGLGDVGQLGVAPPDQCERGDGDAPCANVPQQVTDGVSELWAGGTLTCARRLEGGIDCWGYVGEGRFDDPYLAALGGSVAPDEGRIWTEPTALPAPGPVRGLAIGKEHLCMLLEDQTVRCFGSNRAGQLGDGSFDAADAPGVNPGLERVVALAAGRLHTCAATEDAAVLCWGDDETSQLGSVASEQCTSVEGFSYPCEPEPSRVNGF
ncbi:MAG: RCC1 domain-containing protein [Myxococcota bacterium]